MERRYLTLKDADKAEFYEIFDDAGVKSIHIFCYYYKRDDEDLPWARVDGTFLIVPLEEFIKEYAEEETEYLDNILWAETKQYQYDLTKDEMKDNFEGQYNILPYEDITMDTPYGNYMSI